MKITIVYDNETIKPGLKADWGFSALIQSEGQPPLLFDTGADGAVLLHNMKELDINPDSIGKIVISHAHGDHTGGLLDILKKNNKAEVYVPSSYGFSEAGRKTFSVLGPLKISERVFSTGVLRGIEQSLALETDKGILVMTGCSHPGVGEIIDAASKFGKVYGIIGGFHGFSDFKRLSGLSQIVPCHCTQYKSKILKIFPDVSLECGAGLVLEE
jgi:7,8-dihydropterin-6-yl-methyl-4-(beta-D-ribofuranosyl)aminobenzene 5'-phosphate synthase